MQKLRVWQGAAYLDIHVYIGRDSAAQLACTAADDCVGMWRCSDLFLGLGMHVRGLVIWVNGVLSCLCCCPGMSACVPFVESNCTYKCG